MSIIGGLILLHLLVCYLFCLGDTTNLNLTARNEQIHNNFKKWQYQMKLTLDQKASHLAK